MPYAHVIVACKYINIDYLQYVSPMCTLNYVSSVYKVLVTDMRHHDYWSSYEGPQLCDNPITRRNKKRSTKMVFNLQASWSFKK